MIIESTVVSCLFLTCFQMSFWFIILLKNPIDIYRIDCANICNLGACVSLIHSCLVQQTFQGIEQALPPCLNTLSFCPQE